MAAGLGAECVLVRPLRHLRLGIRPDPVDPSDDRTIYTLGLGLNVSHDAGKTFTTLKVPHGDHHGLWIDPVNPSILYNANDGGVFTSIDGGAAWKFAVSAGGALFYDVAVDASVPAWAYGSIQDVGSRRGQAGPDARPRPHPGRRLDQRTGRRGIAPFDRSKQLEHGVFAHVLWKFHPRRRDQPAGASCQGKRWTKAARAEGAGHVQHLDTPEGSRSARPVDGADHCVCPQARTDLRRLPVCLPVAGPGGHVGAHQRRSLRQRPG